MKPARGRRQQMRIAALPLGARRALVGGATLLALLVVIGVDYLPPSVPLTVGQPSPRDLVAPRAVEFVDVARTEARRAEAMRGVAPVVRHSPAQARAALAAAAAAFDAIERARASGGRTPADRAALAARPAGVVLTPAAASAAVRASASELTAARRAALRAVEQALDGEIPEEGLSLARERARNAVREALPTSPLAALATEVALAVLRPTVVADPVRTAEARVAAAELVEPVVSRVQRGQMIVRKGDVVTPAHLQILAAAGEYPARATWRGVAGVAVVLALLLLVAGIYLRQFQTEVWEDDRRLVLWCLVVAGTVGLAQAVGAPRFSDFLMPAAAGSMTVAILLRPRLALFTATLLAVLVGLAAGRELAPVVVAFVGGLVGVYAARQIHRRSDIGLAGVLVGLASAASALGVGLLAGVPAYPAMAVNAAYALGTGLLSAVVAIGVLPFLEQLFGLVTPIKLLELASPAHPLLRRLQVEAPGTYHHSIMVGNLAEAAAEVVGADALLVRVGTYYHDVGKLRRPAFFVENQGGIENPHDRMTPSLSALTVSAHVRDGLELAREHGLPKAVADFIPQHHGTALLSYFYHQALERGDPLDESAFRYEGPRPQNRETAIVMLADAVEAAARSLSRPTPDRLEEVVRRLIREKLEDGQLDECGLTFRDLHRIAGAFVRILTGFLHPRLEYPDLEAELARRRRDQVARAR